MRVFRGEESQWVITGSLMFHAVEIRDKNGPMIKNNTNNTNTFICSSMP